MNRHEAAELKERVGVLEAELRATPIAIGDATATEDTVSGEWGFATLYANLATTDATALIEGYTRAQGNTNPGAEPATVNNPNAKEGTAGDTCIVVYDDNAEVWNLAVVLDIEVSSHGVATLSAELTSGGTASINNYRAESGTDTPPGSGISNPSGLIGAVGVDVDVALVSGTWRVVDVRGQLLATALANGAAATSAETVDIDNFKQHAGSAVISPPTPVKKDLGVEIADDALLLLTTFGGEWKVSRVFQVQSSGGGETVRSGRVESATGPTFTAGGDVMDQGEILVYEHILPADVADFDAGVDYDQGNFARETGTIYRANTNITAGAFNAAEWTSVSVDADLLIDRNQPTVAVPSSFHDVPPAGALIEWDSQGIRVLTCDAPAEWT